MRAKVKYMIHTCLERKWYTEKFLVPRLKLFGIKSGDILVYVGAHEYNPAVYLDDYILAHKSCADMKKGTYVWHMEDDVYPCDDFNPMAQMIASACFNMDNGGDKLIPAIGIVSGYRERKTRFSPFVDKECVGDHWMEAREWDKRFRSSKCIMIRSDISEMFINWYEVKRYSERLEKPEEYGLVGIKDFDDLFNLFLSEMNKSYEITFANWRDSLVENVDYLIGGSVRKFKPNIFSHDKALYFRGADGFSAVKGEIKKEYKDHKNDLKKYIAS